MPLSSDGYWTRAWALGRRSPGGFELWVASWRGLVSVLTDQEHRRAPLMQVACRI